MVGKIKRPMKIMTVVGARPQFVKAAVVSRAIAEYNRNGAGPTLEETIIHTGQHYDHNMSEVFFMEMSVPAPAVNLNVGSGSHAGTTGAMMVGVEEQIQGIKPDVVLVYGDTNSTMATALAAAKLHVPVAHVEAGLRSFNRAMPEEINRIVTDHVSTILFCPSSSSAAQLAREGITQGAYVVGDVMYDAVLFYRDRAVLSDIEGDFALCTIHRAENTSDVNRLKNIAAGLSRSPVKVVLALHPGTRKIAEANGVKWPDTVRVEQPLAYLSMLGYLKECSFVVTDSGGLQKEAYFLGKRCVTIRDETEWTELVDAGANTVAGTNPDRIGEAIGRAMNAGCFEPRNIYGAGKAGERIVEVLAGTKR